MENSNEIRNDDIQNFTQLVVSNNGGNLHDEIFNFNLRNDADDYPDSKLAILSGPMLLRRARRGQDNFDIENLLGDKISLSNIGTDKVYVLETSYTDPSTKKSKTIEYASLTELKNDLINEENLITRNLNISDWHVEGQSDEKYTIRLGDMYYRKSTHMKYADDQFDELSWSRDFKDAKLFDTLPEAEKSQNWLQTGYVHKITRQEMGTQKLEEELTKMSESRKDQSELGEQLSYSRVILNNAFASPERLAKYVGETAGLQHFDARQQAELLAQNQGVDNAHTLATRDTLEKHFISYKDETPVATIHTGDGHLTPVFDVGSFSKKQYSKTNGAQIPTSSVAKAKLNDNSILDYHKYDYKAKKAGFGSYSQNTKRTYKPNGTRDHDNQILKNVLAEHIAKKQLGLLKKETGVTLPEKLGADLSQYDTFEKQRDFLKDVLRQSRIITTSVQKNIDANRKPVQELGEKTAEISRELTDAKNIEATITHAAPLLNLSTNNRTLVADTASTESRYGDRKTYEKLGVKIDFDQLNGVEIFAPKISQEKGKALEFTTKKIYSLAEVADHIGDAQLREKLKGSNIGLNTNIRNATYQQRLTTVNQAMKDLHVSSINEAQNGTPANELKVHITQYMVRRYAGIDHNSFAFNEYEQKNGIKNLKPAELQQIYHSANNLASKVARTVDKQLYQEMKQQRHDQPIQKAVKASMAPAPIHSQHTKEH